jgi:hypothetical protein
MQGWRTALSTFNNITTKESRAGILVFGTKLEKGE